MPLNKIINVQVSRGTKYRDYVLTDYEPLLEPWGKLHPVSLFRYALHKEGLLAVVDPALRALRSALGAEETVWGIKYGPNGFSGELYFYNDSQNAKGNPKSVARIKEIMRPFFAIPGHVPGGARYFMCSLEFTAESFALGRLGEFRLYFSDGGRGGYSFSAGDNGLLLENHYSFYKIPAELEEARRKVRLSVRTGGNWGTPSFFPGYCLPCHTICHAIKPESDALYFSRITTGKLTRFAAELPCKYISKFLRKNRSLLGHLLWDVGFDYCSASGHRCLKNIGAGKFGIYGVL